MSWGSFSFSVVASLVPIEGMMNLYKYIDVIERKAIPVPCLSSVKVKTIFRKQN